MFIKLVLDLLLYMSFDFSWEHLDFSNVLYGKVGILKVNSSTINICLAPVEFFESVPLRM